jgi:hypothetical protein
MAVIEKYGDTDGFQGVFKRIRDVSEERHRLVKTAENA